MYIYDMYFLTPGRFIEAYIYSTLVFLILRLFFVQVRERTAGFLHAANGLVLVLLLLNALDVVVFAVRCEGCYGVYFYSYLIGTFLLGFAFQLCFFYRRFRVRVSLTVVSIVLLFIYINYNWVIILTSSIFRDYLPSTWSTHYLSPIWDKVVMIGTAAVYFAVCWVWAGRRGKSLA